jgi:membrane associated rhomboid family serine protease
VIYALIAANLVAFAIELASGGGWSGPRGQQMVDLGADYGPLTLHGEWWRLGTSMFLHFGVLHIFFNMACLWQAQLVEAIFGHDGIAAIYLVAGLVGGVASLARHPTAVGAGASGAVFGVYGAFGAFLWLRRAHIPPDLWSKTVRSMGFFLALNLVFGLSVPSIDMSAHVGGLVAGAGAGALLLVGRAARTRRPVRSVGLAAIGVAIAVGGVLVLDAPDDVQPVLARFSQVEHQCLDTLEDLSGRLEAHELSGAQLADRIDRDVLGPWRPLGAELDALHPPPRLTDLVGDLRRYWAARQAEWEAFAAALRAPPDEQAARLAESQARRDETRRRLDAVNAEYDRLEHHH